MITAKILNSDANLNSFQTVAALEFIQGEQIRLVIRLTQTQRTDFLRYTPADAAATVSVTLPLLDGTFQDFEMTAFPRDPSIWYVDLQETDTENLASGNFTLSVDELGDGSKITRGFVQNGLSLIITGGAC